jgi:hypothetical protein
LGYRLEPSKKKKEQLINVAWDKRRMIYLHSSDINFGDFSYSYNKPSI